MCSGEWKAAWRKEKRIWKTGLTKPLLWTKPNQTERLFLMRCTTSEKLKEEIWLMKLQNTFTSSIYRREYRAKSETGLWTMSIKASRAYYDP